MFAWFQERKKYSFATVVRVNWKLRWVWVCVAWNLCTLPLSRWKTSLWQGKACWEIASFILTCICLFPNVFVSIFQCICLNLKICALDKRLASDKAGKVDKLLFHFNMYLSFCWNIFVCICLYFETYLFLIWSIFISIWKCICLNVEMCAVQKCREMKDSPRKRQGVQQAE